MNQSGRPNAPSDRSAQQEPVATDVWAVVLAAGEGQRLAEVTQMLYGRPIPKQFAMLDGHRTLLQTTMDRIESEIPPSRTVVVVAKDQFELAAAQLSEFRGVRIVEQPENRGTGPGVLLALSVISALTRSATVVVLPSDHHIDDPARFVGSIRKAMVVVKAVPDTLALVGAEADRPASDLGWIVPAAAAGAEPDVSPVVTFVEKPAAARAAQLFQSGALWNTLVVVGRLDAFWRQARRHLPEQTWRFDTYVAALTLAQLDGGTDAEHGAKDLLDRLYRTMPAADFSRTVLEQGQGLSVIRLRGAGWSDCGTPERLLACLGGDVTPGEPEQVLTAIARAARSWIVPAQVRAGAPLAFTPSEST